MAQLEVRTGERRLGLPRATSNDFLSAHGIGSIGPRPGISFVHRHGGSSAAGRRGTRVLAAGVDILEQGGYEAFTVAAVCQRAQVPPRAIYARAASKDSLFLAVYDHTMARIRAEHAVFATAETDDEEFLRSLTGIACSYLLRG